MQGPRAPKSAELPQVYEFLNKTLREGSPWSIDSEYPTAMNPGNLSNMRIIAENDKILSHALIKSLIIKSPTLIYKVAAIGSVVTDAEHRGEGLSTQILGACLENAEKQNCDFAVLWTDQYDFYRRLGFELAGSEVSLVFNADFEPPVKNIKYLNSTKVSPEAILRLYNHHTVGSVRMTEDIRKYLSIPNTTLHTAWDDSNQLLAYAVEGKGADLQGYIHEWGGTVSALVSLISHVRRAKGTNLTMIVPRHSINLLGQLRGLPVTINEGYLGMIKLLNHDTFFAKVKKAAQSIGVKDLVLEKGTNGFQIGRGENVVTLSTEGELVQALFGPQDFVEMGYFKADSARDLGRIFPLNLWIWGWDSV
jgi:predicted N-acetyltransferase YhbS